MRLILSTCGLDVSRWWIFLLYTLTFELRYTPISNKDFLETIYRPVYGQDAGIYGEALNPHSLALLFMVLAMGTLMDLDLPGHSPQATQFYQLGRAALAIKSVFDEQSIPGIQALVNICLLCFPHPRLKRTIACHVSFYVLE